MAECAVCWKTILVDFLTLGLGGLILAILKLAISPTKRGFFCDDESIRYRFKSSTIPDWALNVYAFAIPFIVIIITEIVVNRKKISEGLFIFRHVPVWILCTYRSLIDFLFGCVCSQLITDIGKYSVGRLRPHFIDVCKPNIDLVNCAQYGGNYITNYYCTSRASIVAESRLSFPSGHASFSAYAMLYIAIFIQVKWHVDKKTIARLFKHAFQLALILLAYFTAISRIKDNKHHWSDVLAGGLIGSIVAIVVSRCVSGLFKGIPDSKCDTYFYDLTGSKKGSQRNHTSDIVASVPSGMSREHMVEVPEKSSSLHTQ